MIFDHFVAFCSHFGTKCYVKDWFKQRIRPELTSDIVFQTHSASEVRQTPPRQAALPVADAGLSPAPLKTLPLYFNFSLRFYLQGVGIKRSDRYLSLVIYDWGFVNVLIWTKCWDMDTFVGQLFGRILVFSYLCGIIAYIIMDRIVARNRTLQSYMVADFRRF